MRGQEFRGRFFEGDVLDLVPAPRIARGKAGLDRVDPVGELLAGLPGAFAGLGETEVADAAQAHLSLAAVQRKAEYPRLGDTFAVDVADLQVQIAPVADQARFSSRRNCP